MEFFVGYRQDPVEILQQTFDETDGYDEMIVLRDIEFFFALRAPTSFQLSARFMSAICRASAWLESASSRVSSEIFARRMQIQEKMTAQIANTLNEVLAPKGVAVVIEAVHQCMTTRGVQKPGVSLVTSRMLGDFRDDPMTRREFLSIIGNPSHSSTG